MESNIVLNRELEAYKGEKKLTEMAVLTKQQEIAQQLKNEMGTDMMAVLNGEKIIKISSYKKNKFKFTTWLKKILRKF